MIMKKIIFSTILALTFCTSCTNLKSEMYDVIDPSFFPKSEADAEALITAAVYSPFRSSWYSGLFTSAWGGIHVHTEMTTDIGYCQWNDAVWPDLLNVNFTANSSGPTRIYGDYINSISKMTQTIPEYKI